MKRHFLIVIISFLFFNNNFYSQSVGGLTTGGASYCDSLNSGFISLSNHVGAILGWESSTDNGNNWIFISNPTNQQNYFHVQQTIWYRAIVQDGISPPDTSNISIITIYPKAIGGTILGGGEYCLSASAGTLNLTGEVGQVQYWEFSINDGTSWTSITNTTTSQTYTTITQSIQYRAIVKNIAACPNAASDIVQFTVYQNTIPGSLLSSDTICYNSNIDTLKLSGQLGNVIGWLKSTTSPFVWSNIGHADTLNYKYLNLLQTTSFAVLVKNGVCPSDTSDVAVLTVVQANTVTAGPDKDITRYQTTTLEASGTGTVSWNPTQGLSDASLLNPTAMPLTSTTYTITLTDNHKCISRDEVTVKVEVKTPSAITPNGDGMNDNFEIDKIETFPNSSLLVYNRWGNLVFKTAPYTNNWNGKSIKGQDLPDEIYYYILDYGVGEKPLTGYVLIKR